MTMESLETQLARLDERFKTILAELQSARESRKDQYEQIEDLGRSMINMNNRMMGVENSLAKSAPTIEEFITIKQKVVAAGALGRWAWVFLSFILGIAASFRTEIIAWFSK